jgi:tetratricopeptide (TPR) repeat protein
MRIASRTKIIALLLLSGAVFLTALILPAAAGAWFRNVANARIARAMSLPADVPARLAALNDADAQLAQARTWSAPRDALVAFAQARAFFARDDAPRAADTLRATGNALRDDFIAQFVWGQAELQAGNPTAAFDRWRAAGALDYFTNQSLRLSFKHQWQDAEKYARIAVGIAPERAETHYYLADALGYQTPDNPEALRELDRAAELTRDPEFLSTILSRKGELLATEGRDRDALAAFDRARQAAPRDARPRIGYAVTLLHLDPNAEKQVVEILKQVVNDAPWTISAHLALARIAESRGDIQSAEEWYRAALARDAINPDALFAVGQFYARQKRIDGAKKMLTLALKYETHTDDQQAITRVLAELDAR